MHVGTTLVKENNANFDKLNQFKWITVFALYT